MKVFIFFLLFIITYEYIEDSKSVILKLYRDQIVTSGNKSETIRQLQYNKIYINPKIGSNNKSIKLYLRFNEYLTYITNNFYNKDESNTYEFTRKKEGGGNAEFIPNQFLTDDLTSGYESKDVLKLDENKLILKDFNFILVDKLNKAEEFYYPIIGLNLVSEINKRPALFKTNLVEQLKNNEIISNKIFSILYFKNVENNNIEKGEIIFGKLPHELDINDKNNNFIFKEDNLFWINADIGNYNLKWKIKFDSVKYSNEEISDLTTELIIEQYLFTGPWQFRDIIKKNFFKELITKQICKEEQFYNNRDKFKYYFYSCESSLKSDLSKDKYKNDILQFSSNTLNKIFSFSLEELFIEKGTKLYFSIIFDELNMFGWRLGSIFLEKYPLVFSLDNKAIGYYNQDVSNIKSIPNSNSKSKTTIILIVLILLLILIIFFGIIKYNILKKLIPRKLMANELLDNYSYNSHDDNNINSENKNDNEITTEMIYKNKSNENQEKKLGI